MASFDKILDTELLHEHQGDEIEGGKVGGVIPVEAVVFDTLYTKNGEPVGSVYWNTDRDTLELLTGSGEVQVGEDLFFHCINQTGSNIPKGTAVMYAGALGASGKIKIAPAIADGSVPSIVILGVTKQAIANGDEGKVLVIGELSGFDTSVFGADKILYIDPTNPGGYTITEPQAPNLKYPIAATLDSKSNGNIAVRAIFTPNLSELNDVQITTPQPDDLLAYDSTNSRWENKSLATIADGRFVNVTGDTMTGDLKINANSTTAVVVEQSGVKDNVLVVDATNGRVGINTASPAAPFHIYSDSVVSGIGALLLGTKTNTSTALSVNARAMFGYDATRGTAVVQGLLDKGIDFNVNDSTFGSGQAMTISPAGAVNVVNNITAANLSGTNTGDQTVREILSADRTYYVATTGSDSNDGLTAGSPFLTIQKAVDTISVLDIAGYTVTIQVADGTYTGAVSLKNVVGFAASGNLVIQGNTGNMDAVVISTTSSNCFSATGISAVWFISYMQLKTTTSGSCLIATLGSAINYNNINFGTCAGSHIRAESGALIRINGTASYTISGGAVYHFLAIYDSVIYGSGGTITLTGTPAPAFSIAFVGTQTGSAVRLDGMTFSGSATGVRYSATLNSTIFAGTAPAETYFPGDTTGIIASDGFYGAGVSTQRVATNFTKNNTTLSNITGLTENLLAGRTYRFKATLYTTSNIASGVKFAITGSATVTSMICEAATYQAGIPVAIGTSRATARGTAIGDVTAVTAATCIIEGTVTVNGAGTWVVQFATNAGTNVSTVLTGSTMEVEDIT